MDIQDNIDEEMGIFPHPIPTPWLWRRGQWLGLLGSWYQVSRCTDWTIRTVLVIILK